MWSPWNSKFFSTKSRKGKSKPKANIPRICAPKSSPASIPSSVPPLQPPPPPLPRGLFPYYSPTSSTPLPPPSMPKKRFLRRYSPFLLAATGAYVLLRISKHQSSEKEVKLEKSSIPVVSAEAVVAERTAQ